MKRFITIALAVVLCLCPVGVAEAAELIPVGRVIGLELCDGSVSVAAFDEVLGQPAKAAGLQLGDRIVKIDGLTIKDASDVRDALARSDGKVDITVLRGEQEHGLSLTPQITAEGPRLGVSLRQGITGLGTVTWYNPTSGRFGALGHGVSNSRGELVAITGGRAFCASVLSVRKGTCGNPGQLRGGVEGDDVIGEINQNTAQGIFGKAQIPWDGTPIPTGQACEGDAKIISVVSGSEPQEYSVEILKIYPKSKCEGRNLLLRVTDPDLLSATGGIVQGMSGSPIIQDGKLIGAVTHVLVNDPTTGYGIFIENMLEAAA